MKKLQHQEITSKIIAAFYEVYNNLRYGHREKTYENALLFELKRQALLCETQKAIPIFYKGQLVGSYFADICVENIIVLELKTVKEIEEIHEIQLNNYLKSSEYEVGLLLNFGIEAEFKRKVYTNGYKRVLSLKK